MTLTRTRHLRIPPFSTELAEDTSVEPGTTEIDCLPFSDVPDVMSHTPDWSYSGSAEDNAAGTPGDSDGQQGLIYSGPSGVSAMIVIGECDTIEHAITPPEATDTACAVILINSKIVAFADEGYVAHASETVTEFNLDASVTLMENDVVRCAISFKGEEADADLDLAPGSISIS